MKKILLIGWKDVKLAFRDRTALILMLLAPFVLTLGMGLVTGSLGTSNPNVVSNIPVVLVNQDENTLGNTLVEVFQSEKLQDLFTVTKLDDPEAAIAEVTADRTAAAVIIPAGFTESLMASQGSSSGSDAVKIQLIANPTRPTNAGIVQTIVSSFLSQVEIGRVGAEVTISQLLDQGLIQPQDAPALAQKIGTGQAILAESQQAIQIKGVTSAGESVEFNVLGYLAPGYALLFLMYTATNAGRNILVEKREGTLPRLLVSPTTASQVLSGKMVGSYITGALQMLILILASTILFQLQWGDPLAVLVLVLAAVFGAVGWGMLISAIIRTPGQATTIGSALMLTFGILGGSFFDLGALPDWIRVISSITPNYWGQNGFLSLTLGAGLVDIWKPLLALMIMGLLLFSISAILFKRRGVFQA